VQVDRIDHFVLTVRDVDATVRFYERVMDMHRVVFAGGRVALHFGRSKINLHAAAAPYEPHAAQPVPGSADLCFIVTTPIPEVLAHLAHCGVDVESGPVPKTGALGPMTSVYFRDPDGNLIEVSNYPTS
jgi:catechol 2,3-dioxygenase-like lactoylglutathione lyase family enzyme